MFLNAETVRLAMNAKIIAILRKLEYRFCRLRVVFEGDLLLLEDQPIRREKAG